jgi:hypothetical protein
MRDEEMLAEIEDFIEGFNQPTYCGMRVNGVRVATWSSRHGWSGDTPARGGVASRWRRTSPNYSVNHAGSYCRPECKEEKSRRDAPSQK